MKTQSETINKSSENIYNVRIMFCPKCGTENPATGRFCRSCGTDLGNVSAALGGQVPGVYAAPMSAPLAAGITKSKDPAELAGEAINQALVGIGFLVAAIVLLTTGVAGGKLWWWAMLFPAFGCLGKAVSLYYRSKNVGRFQQYGHLQNAAPPSLSEHQIREIYDLSASGMKIQAIKNYREWTGAGLAESKAAVERIEANPLVTAPPVAMPSPTPPANSLYDTGEIKNPPSVTEDTTRHLEINKEGETMTLPKSNL